MSSPSNSGDKSLIFEDSMKSMNKCLIWFYGRSESSHISQKQYLSNAGFQKLPSSDDDALKRSQVRLGKANFPHDHWSVDCISQSEKRKKTMK